MATRRRQGPGAGGRPMTTDVARRSSPLWVIGGVTGLSIFAAVAGLAPLVFPDQPSFEAATIGGGAVAAALCIGGRQRSWYSPLYVLAVAWTLVGVINPLLAGLQDRYSSWVLGVNVTASLVAAALLGGVGVCAMAFGMRVSLHQPASIARLQEFRLYPAGGPMTELFLVLIYLIATALLIQQVGFGTLLSWRSDPSRQVLSDTSNYLIYTGYFLIVPALARLMRASSLISTTALIGWLMLLLSQLIAILSGSRIAVIPCLLSVFIVLSLRHKHSSRATLAVLLVAVLGVAIGFRVWRQSSDVVQASLGQNSISYIAVDVFAGQDTAMLGNFAVVVQAGSYARADFPGEAYLISLVRPIPRELWASKPQTLDQQLNALLLPVQYQQGYGFSFTCFAEALYNGGLLGVILVSFLLGLCWGWVYWRLLAPSSPRHLLLAVAVIPLLIVILRGSVSADYPQLVLTALPVLFYRGS